MVATITLVIVLDNVLDAMEALFARLDVPDEIVEVAVRLVATVADLVVVVAMARDEVDDDLVCHQILPVCGSDGGAAVAERDLGRGEVSPAFVQQVTDAVMLECFYAFAGRRHYLSDGRVWATGRARISTTIALTAALCARACTSASASVSAVGAVGMAVHGAGRSGHRRGNAQQYPSESGLSSGMVKQEEASGDSTWFVVSTGTCVRFTALSQASGSRGCGDGSG